MQRNIDIFVIMFVKINKYEIQRTTFPAKIADQYTKQHGMYGMILVLNDR